MTVESHHAASTRQASDRIWYAGVILAAIALWGAYSQLIPFSEWVTSLLPIDRDSHTGAAVAFFVYDVPKVLLLLTAIVFVTGVLRSWFSPEKTRAILAGKREAWGYPLAALLGVLTLAGSIRGYYHCVRPRSTRPIPGRRVCAPLTGSLLPAVRACHIR